MSGEERDRREDNVTEDTQPVDTTPADTEQVETTPADTDAAPANADSDSQADGDADPANVETTVVETGTSQVETGATPAEAITTPTVSERDAGPSRLDLPEPQPETQPVDVEPTTMLSTAQDSAAPAEPSSSQPAPPAPITSLAGPAQPDPSAWEPGAPVATDDWQPRHPRGPRMATIVLGLVLMAAAITALVHQVTEVQVDAGAVGLGVMATAGLLLFGSALISAVRGR